MTFASFAYNYTGLNILFSGAIDVFNASNEAYHVLIPAIVEALTTVQTPNPYPPDPQTYEGVYSLGVAGVPNAQIITYQNQLVMTGIVNVFLAYREPLNLQVSPKVITLHDINCLNLHSSQGYQHFTT